MLETLRQQLIPHRTPLAWLNLTHNVRRLALALAGVGFAVLLMSMELSFREALFNSTVAVIRHMNADLIITSRAKYTIVVREPFSHRRLAQARSSAAVAGVWPLYIETRTSNLKNRSNGEALPIRVLAFNPDDPVFDLPEVEQHLVDLRMPDRALYDRQSKPEYGPVTPGKWIELAGRRVLIVGMFALGTDFANDGNMITSDLTFRKHFPGPPGEDPLDSVDIGLVRLNPGYQPQDAQRDLRARLPDDVTVYTRGEFINQELQFWKTSTPIGYIFWLGAMMGFIVGSVICYQILYTDVSDHLSEFATLKAMGYPNRYFFWVIVQQSVMLSLLGFFPGIICCEAICRLVAWATNLDVGVHPATALTVLAMSVTMCVISGCAAVRRVIIVDPAELF